MASWKVVSSGKVGKSRTKAWTVLMIESAVEACEDFELHCGRPLVVDREVSHKGYRIDALAKDRQSGDYVVAFESELAYWGIRAEEKDWREESSKLCTSRLSFGSCRARSSRLRGPISRTS